MSYNDRQVILKYFLLTRARWVKDLAITTWTMVVLLKIKNKNQYKQEVAERLNAVWLQPYPVVVNNESVIRAALIKSRIAGGVEE